MRRPRARVVRWTAIALVAIAVVVFGVVAMRSRSAAQPERDAARGWRLRARSEGEAIPDRRYDADPSSIDPIGLVPRREGREITGLVLDRFGGVIEGAEVVAATRRRVDLSRTTSNAEGMFSLWGPPGAVELRIAHFGYANTEVLARRDESAVQVYLLPASSISGTVRERRSGAPVVGFTVRAGDGFTAVDEVVAISGSDGRYTLQGLPPGSYRPHAFGPGGAGRVHADVALQVAQDVEHADIEVDVAHEVVGTVVVDGKACGEGLVHMRSAEGFNQHWAEVDAEGAIRIVGVRPGRYSVQPSCKGAEPVPSGTLEVDAHTKPQRWALRMGCEITGVVVDDHDRVVEHGYVTASGIGETVATADSAAIERGEFTIAGLPEGRYEVRATSSEHTETFSAATVDLAPRADGCRGAAKVTLRSGASIVGTVRDVGDVGMPGVRITAETSQSTIRVARSGQDGAFELLGLHPGPVKITVSSSRGDRLRVRGNGDTWNDHHTLEIATEKVAQDLVVESTDQRITGVVIDGGDPVEHVVVQAVRSSSTSWLQAKSSWRERGVLTDGDGAFTIDELPSGEYDLYVFGRGHGSGNASGIRAGTAGVRVLLQQPGGIQGKLGHVSTRAQSSPIHVQAIAVGATPSRFATVGADRRFVIENVQAGTYRIAITAADGTADVAAVEVGAGAVSDVGEIDLRPFGRARGCLGGINDRPVAGVIVSASTPFGPVAPQQATSDADGCFRIEGLRPGRVTLIFRDPREGELVSRWPRVVLEIPPGEVVDIGIHAPASG